jgi:hypothetical protein
MLRKITVFQCDTCNRQIELELDERRPYPLRCSITYKCPGIYKKITEKNSRSTLFPPIVYGLQDYIQRGSEITLVPVVESDPLVSVLAGKHQLVLGAMKKETIESSPGQYDNWATEPFWDVTSNQYINDLPYRQMFLYGSDITNPNVTGQQTHPFQDHKILLELYELPLNSTEFKEYYFLKDSNTTQISGQDDSLFKSVLRFNETDNIVVTINGISLPRYNQYLSQSQYFIPIISNSGERAIKFVPTLTDSSNAIKIYVYQKIETFKDPSKVRTLIFKGMSDNDQNRSTNSWGDVTHIDINNPSSDTGKIDRFLFTCTEFEVTETSEPLTINNRYLIKSIKAIKYTGQVVILNPKDIHLLLGQSPYSYSDKTLDLTLNMNDAINSPNGIILQYIQDEHGNDNLYVEKSSLCNLVEAINILETVNSEIIPNSGFTEVNEIDSLISSKYIIGYA